MIWEIISIIVSILCIAGIGLIVQGKMHVLASIDTAGIPKERDAAVKRRIITQRLKRNISFFQEVFVFIGKPFLLFFTKLQYQTHTFYHGLVELRERHQKIPLSGGKKDEKKLSGLSSCEALLHEAQIFSEKEDYEHAEKKCIDVIGQDKKNKEAYRILGEIYIQQREWDHAQEVLECNKKIFKAEIRESENRGEDAGDLRIAYANLLIDLAGIYKKLEKNDRALTVIKEAIELQESNPKFLHELVDIYIVTGQRLKAEKALDSLKKANPENQKLSELGERIEDLQY